MITDQGFGVPVDAQTRGHWSEANTYMYVLAMRPNNTGEVFPAWMGEYTGQYRTGASHRLSMLISAHSQNIWLRHVVQ